jgi:hypothetical protein
VFSKLVLHVEPRLTNAMAWYVVAIRLNGIPTTAA